MDHPRPHKKNNSLKVAFLAGTLAQGGAEKQLFYMAKALYDAGTLVTVFSLSHQEYYHAKLQETGIPVVRFGKRKNPFIRLIKIIIELNRFQPDIIQSSHFYMNIYAGIAGLLLNKIGIGAVRGDVRHAAASNRFRTKWLLKLPKALIVNSRNAYKSIINSKKDKSNLVYHFANVLDISRFDNSIKIERAADCTNVTVISIGNLRQVKRFDLFLEALAIARKQVPSLKGIIAGDGPEKCRLEGLAWSLGLLPDGVEFSGRRDDADVLLQKADIFVLSSDYEGFPNVLLEAMAARLPAVTTSAGDAGLIVRNGINGYVVAPGDTAGMSNYIVRLSRSPELRLQMGETGKRYVKKQYDSGQLAKGLFQIYYDIAKRTHKSIPAITGYQYSMNEVQV